MPHPCGVFVRRVLLFVCAGIAGAACADSTWKAGVWSGSWSVANNWDGGVPTSSSSATISNSDGDYCVRVDNLASVSSLSLLNGSDYTSILAVSNTMTVTSGATWSIGAGGILQIGAGGAVSLPNVGGSVVDGGKMVVDGGSVSWNAQGKSYAIGTRTQSGSLEIKSGSVVYNANGGWGHYIQLGAKGSIDVSGGELVLKGATNHEDPPYAPLFQQAYADGDAPLVVRNDGRLDLSVGAQAFSSYCLLTNNAVMDFGSNVRLFSVRNAYGDDYTTRLELKDKARIAGSTGPFRIGGYTWWSAKLKAPVFVTLDSDAVHGTGLQTDNLTKGCGQAFSTVYLGDSYGTNELNLCRGFLPIGMYGVKIGVADTPYATTAGSNTLVQGVLNVRGGNLFVNGWAGSVVWGYDPTHCPYGLIVGQGLKANVGTGHKGQGAINLSSGSITNAAGHFLVGMGVAEGSYSQSGGTFVSNPTSEWAPNMSDVAKRTKAVAAIGLRSGTGRFALGGGTFRIGSKFFVGGAPVAEFAANNADFVKYWDDQYPAEDTSSVGLAEFDGGEFVGAGDFIVGAAGSGSVAFGPSASVTIGGDFVLSNRTSSVVKFKAGVGGFQPVDVKGRFVVADGAKIEVDLTDYKSTERLCLVQFASNEGKFSDENITVRPSSIRLVQRKTGLYARRSGGFVVIFK